MTHHIHDENRRRSIVQSHLQIFWQDTREGYALLRHRLLTVQAVQNVAHNGQKPVDG